MHFRKRALNLTAPPSAFFVQPSGKFDDQDGLWSTFNLDVGGSNATGAQSFRAVISTSGSQTWLPNAAACSSYASANFRHFPPNCPDSRGVGQFDAQASSGYNATLSDTLTGSSGGTIYSATLASYTSLGGNLSTIFGAGGINYAFSGPVDYDYLHFKSVAGAMTINSSAPAVIFPESSQWILLPTVGLGHARTTTDTGTSDAPIQAMYNGGLIPSQSWGYTAGAYYDNSRPGSLTLGGYDLARLPNGNDTAQFNLTGGELPVVAVSSITFQYKNSSSSGPSYINSFPAVIDATLPYLFLPNATVDWLVSYLRLNETPTGLLYYNASLPNSANATIGTANNFTIDFRIRANNQASGGAASATTISLPLDALTSSVSWNYNTMNWPLTMVPVRRLPASNPTAILGRAFLQEAYLFVNFDNGTFNLSQTTSGTPANPTIYNVLSQEYLNGGASTPSPTVVPTVSSTPIPNPTLSGGAIAGIVIGSIAAVLLIVGALLWFRRKKRSEAQKKQAMLAPDHPESPELQGSETANRGYHRDSMMSESTAVSELFTRPSQRRHLSEMSDDSELGGPKAFNTLGPLQELEQPEEKNDAAQLEGMMARHQTPPPPVELPGEYHGAEMSQVTHAAHP